MPIIPNVIGFDRQAATTSMNNSGFTNLNFYGGTGDVTDVESESGQGVGKNVPASEQINLELRAQS